MMDDPQVGVVAARVSNLESQVSQIEGRQESTFLGRNENGVPQAAADPGGRVAWTSEWRDDAGKMVAYIPGNALVIDGANVDVEAEDKQDDEVPLSAGTWYLHIYRHKTNDSWKAEFNQGATGIDDEDWKAKYDIRIVDIHADGYIEKQYVVGSIVIGKDGVTSLRGDGSLSEEQPSERIEGDIEVTGRLDPADDKSSCGIEFVTVSNREAQGDDPARPARIIAKIKGREPLEKGWGSHTLTIKGKAGDNTVHFLGSADATVEGEGGGGASDVIGSDYIDVGDETDEKGVTKRKVSAKTNTPDPDDRTLENPAHALLTHDTDQLVRSKKTFLPAAGTEAGSSSVVIDNENAKIEVKNLDRKRKIVLDASQIPAEDCNGEINVRTLTVNHPRPKTIEGQSVSSETYHILGCDNVVIEEGDAIEKIESGTSTQSGGYTITPVTITLKDGTSLPAFNVWAKNGTNGGKGDKGDNAGLEVSADTHQPTQEDPRTGIDVTLTPTINGVAQTPIKFTVYDGSRKNPFALLFKEGDRTVASYDGSEEKSVSLSQMEIEEGEGIRFDRNGNVITIVNTREASEQIQSDWEQTDNTAKDFIKNKPDSLKNPFALTIRRTGATTIIYDGSEAKEIDISGSAPITGSDYIDVSTAGKVEAKVPQDGTKGLVTTDLNQQVRGDKSFTNTIKVGTAPNQSEYASSHIYLKAASGNPWITFFNASYESVALLQWSPANNRLQIVAASGIYLGGNADTVTLKASPTASANETDASKKLAVATCGWVNDNYKVTELVKGDNITITPDATNPKKLTISAIGSGRIADHDFIADIKYDIGEYKYKKLVGHCINGTITYGENRVNTPEDAIWTDMVGGGTTPLSGEVTQ